MSRPPHAEDPPNVYVPRAAPSPDYEEYADPAVAHGWQNAYDETSELPRVPGVPDGGWGPGIGGRAARRSHRRRDNRRRTLTAVGALGTASVAALVAGFGFSSDSASNGSEGKKDPARSAKDDSGSRTDPWLAPSSTSTASSEVPGATTSPAATESKDSKKSEENSPTPSATSPTSPEPTTVETLDDMAPGHSENKPGHAGGTKGPR